jgi:hypothetical protein
MSPSPVSAPPAPTPPARPDWLARRPVLRFLKGRLDDWMLRHRLPLNFWLHVVGIPLAIAGVVLLFLCAWYWGVAALVLGYLLQWVGHRAEGNDIGEWAALKRLLGLPYVAVSPRWDPPPPRP